MSLLFLAVGIQLFIDPISEFDKAFLDIIDATRLLEKSNRNETILKEAYKKVRYAQYNISSIEKGQAPWFTHARAE